MEKDFNICIDVLVLHIAEGLISPHTGKPVGTPLAIAFYTFEGTSPLQPGSTLIFYELKFPSTSYHGWDVKKNAAVYKGQIATDTKESYKAILKKLEETGWKQTAHEFIHTDWIEALGKDPSLIIQAETPLVQMPEAPRAPVQ